MFSLTAFSVSGAAVSVLTSHNPSLRFCLGGVLILCCHVFTLGVLFPLEVGGTKAAALTGEGEPSLSPLLLLVFVHGRVKLQKKKMLKEKKSS